MPSFQVLQDFSDVAILLSGMLPDQDQDAVPLWETAKNIQFNNGFIGFTPKFSHPITTETLFDNVPGLFDAATGNFDDASVQLPFASITEYRITSLYQLRTSFAGQRLIYCDDAGGVFLAEGTQQYTAGTGFSGHDWSITNFQDWTFLTNGVEAPQVIKEYTIANAANAPTTSEVVLTYGPHLVYLGHGGSKRQYSWSKFKDPEEFDSLVYATAGSDVVHEMETGIVAAAVIGNAIHAYGDNQFGMINYVGQPYIFGFGGNIRGVGAYSKRSVAYINGVHYVFGPPGIYEVSPGGSYRVIDAQISVWLADRIDIQLRDQCWASTDTITNRIIFGFPGIDGNTYSLYYNYITSSWSYDINEVSAAVPVGVWRTPLVGTKHGKVYAVTDYGTAAATRETELVSKWLDCGARFAYKFFDSLLIKVKEVLGTVYVQAEVQLADGQILGMPGQQLVKGENYYHICKSARFIRFRILSDDVEAWLQMGGLQVYGKIEGSVM